MDDDGTWQSTRKEVSHVCLTKVLKPPVVIVVNVNRDGFSFWLLYSAIGSRSVSWVISGR